MSAIKIVFLRVSDNASKIQRLCAIIQKHHDSGEALLIMAPSEEAAAYMDQLLWRSPEESFLPHAVINAPSHEKVAITTSSKNINNASVLINLCPRILDNLSYRIIYELLDLTHPAKEELSRMRQESYRKAGFPYEEV